MRNWGYTSVLLVRKLLTLSMLHTRHIVQMVYFVLEKLSERKHDLPSPITVVTYSWLLSNILLTLPR
jgi:hypothetical protein